MDLQSERACRRRLELRRDQKNSYFLGLEHKYRQHLAPTMTNGERSASHGRLFEGRRRLAVGLAEGSAEVAVAGEAKVQAELGEILILFQKIEGACEPQP